MQLYFDCSAWSCFRRRMAGEDKVEGFSSVIEVDDPWRCVRHLQLAFVNLFLDVHVRPKPCL
jgi:hypothetical protein